MSTFAQNCGFRLPEANWQPVNTFRWNLASKRRLGSALAQQTWSSLVEDRRYRSPQMWKFVQNYVFFCHWKPTQWTHSDEIWRVSIDHVCTVSCQIWAESVTEHCYNSCPKCKNWVKLTWLGSLHMLLVLQRLSDACLRFLVPHVDNVWVAGKTVWSFVNMCHTWAL